jgi:hypothetical protein
LPSGRLDTSNGFWKEWCISPEYGFCGHSSSISRRPQDLPLGFALAGAAVAGVVALARYRRASALAVLGVLYAGSALAVGLWSDSPMAMLGVLLGLVALELGRVADR